MINAVSSSPGTTPQPDAPSQPSGNFIKPSLIDPTDPPRNTNSSSVIRSVMNPPSSEPDPAQNSKSSFPAPPPAPGSGSQNDQKKKGIVLSPKMVVSGLVLVLMLVGGAVGFYLSQENQDLRQQASTGETVQCPTPNANGAGQTRCSGNTREVSRNIVCSPEQAAQCIGVCDKYEWVAHGEQKWCDASDYYHTCQGGNSTSTGECCGPSCQPGAPPDNSGLDPNTPRTPAQICSAKNGSPSSNNTADPNCSAQGGASCDISGTNYCCYGDSRNSSGVVQRDGNCYNSARQCPAPYTIHKYSCDGATGFCSTHVSTYQSDTKPTAQVCTQFEIVGSDNIGCGGVAPAGGTAGCGTGGPNPPPEPPPTNPPVTQKLPEGYQGTSTCEVATGWTCDPDKFDANVEVHFYIGTATKAETFVGSATAKEKAYNQTDFNQIAAVCGGNGDRRFNFQIPENVKSQTDKYLYAFAINIDKDGNKTHTTPAGVNTQNMLLKEGPKQIVSCEKPPETIAPTVACEPSSGNQGEFSWKHNPLFDRYILRIDKENSCKNEKGETIPWFCGTNQGFPNNTGDQYYLVNAADICANGMCKVTKPVVPGEKYTNASIQWLKPGDSTQADANKMGYSPTFTCAGTPPVIGPMCLSIKAVNPTTNAVLTANQLSTLKKGDALKFQCGATTAPDTIKITYEFQITKAGKVLFSSAPPSGQFSESYTLTEAGSFSAQCRICTSSIGGKDKPICQPWYYPANQGAPAGDTN